MTEPPEVPSDEAESENCEAFAPESASEMLPVRFAPVKVTDLVAVDSASAENDSDAADAVMVGTGAAEDVPVSATVVLTVPDVAVRVAE